MQLALEARYGLQSGDILTLDEVAQKFNVTRERIRQIVGQARAEVKRLEAASGLDPLSESSDIYCLNLGSRAFVILYNMGLKTVRDLLKQSADSLLELKGFGPGALQNVEQTLAEHGWSLK
jgi:DNA-directed RNA polymerase alpha subunit